MTAQNEEMPAKKRLFLAVNLSIATTRRIADAVARMRAMSGGMPIRVSFVPPANLHVTLKFLGWTNAEAIEPIKDQVRAGLLGRKGFELVARGIGAFPNDKNARILWVGIEDPSGALAQLTVDVESWMTRLGYEPEAREFSPHVTIGRVKEGRGAEAILQPFHATEFGTSLIREVVLYESRMRSSGSEYLVVARFPVDVPSYRAERQTREVEGEAIEKEHEETDTNGGQST
ncbi:MAG: RNA 2',3'-cyclic phosphodiesterase [Deltaproteobacteria bacterium]|nr:RNA 2',3'-cyclic phosphodiesterase [Deltaproteobacteria bacterium]